MARIAVETAQDALQIHSPSKLFKDFGKNVGTGFIQGVESIENTVKRAVDSVFGGFSAISGGSAGANTSSGHTIINNYYGTFQVRADEISEVSDLLDIFRDLSHKRNVFEGVG